MSRQIGSRYQEVSMTVLEERLHRLEAKVTTLADALRVLARALEGGPMAEPGDREVADAARQARDLLLAAGMPSPMEKHEGPAAR